jgi:hypothetical protein
MAISTLRGQIVSSPEKLRSSIGDLNSQLMRDQEVLKDTEARERQMNAKMNALAQYSTVSRVADRSILAESGIRV